MKLSIPRKSFIHSWGFTPWDEKNDSLGIGNFNASFEVMEQLRNGNFQIFALFWQKIHVQLNWLETAGKKIGLCIPLLSNGKF